MTAHATVDARAAQKSDTRARLLTAARRLFGQLGPALATVDQIAREAGTSRANFYLHFGGKDDVLHALRREMWRMALDFYEGFAELPDTSQETLHHWLQGVAQAWAQDGGLTRIVLGATPREVEQEYQEHVTQYIDALTRDAGKWRGFSKAQARQRAYLLIVQLERCMNDQDHIDLPVERTSLLRTLAAVWAATLASPHR
ncbi:MAG TPA: helix-turn-helix domain-containing protein [Burkholderiaceae bacterium]|nr:helix-turn-helix domain-containing protein [Burkholderiaceae bacterium]